MRIKLYNLHNSGQPLSIETQKRVISESVFEKASIQADPVKMKLLAICFVFALLFVSQNSSQYISLDITQYHESDDHQSSFKTYTTKKYYFVTFFKVNIS